MSQQLGCPEGCCCSPQGTGSNFSTNSGASRNQAITATPSPPPISVSPAELNVTKHDSSSAPTRPSPSHHDVRGPTAEANFNPVLSPSSSMPDATYDGVGGEGSADTAHLEILRTDLDIELRHRNRFTGAYRSTVVEDHYMVFHSTVFLRLIRSLTALIWCLGVTADLVLRLDQVPAVVHVVRAVFVASVAILAVVQYVLCVKPHQSTEGIFRGGPTPMFHRLAITTKMVESARLSEYLTFAIFVSASLSIFPTYFVGSACYDHAIGTGLPAPHASNICVNEVPPWPTLLQFVAIYVFRMRKGVTFVCFFIPVIVLFAVRPMSHRDTITQLLLKIFLILIPTGCVVGMTVLLEGGTRRRFETSLRLRKSAMQEDLHRQVIVQSLSELFPSIAKLSQNEQVVDAKQCCLVSVFRMDDFDHWGTQHLPAMVAGILELVFTQFDKLARRMLIEKLVTHGDAYWSTVLLRERDEGQRVAQPMALLDYAMQQLRTSDRLLRSSRKVTYKCVGKVAIHCGPCAGIMVGTQRLSYEIFGEVIDSLKRIINCTPPDTVCITKTATCCIGPAASRVELQPVDKPGWMSIPPDIQKFGLSCVQRYVPDMSACDDQRSDEPPPVTPSPKSPSGRPKLSLLKDVNLRADERKRYEYLRQLITEQKQRDENAEDEEPLTELSVTSTERDDKEVHLNQLSASQATRDVVEENSVVDMCSQLTDSSFVTKGTVFVHYVDPTTESIYQQFAYRRFNQTVMMSQVVYCVYVAAILIAVAVEGAHTASGCFIITGVALVAFMRIGVIHRWPNIRYDGLLTLPMAIALLGAVLCNPADLNREAVLAQAAGLEVDEDHHAGPSKTGVVSTKDSRVTGGATRRHGGTVHVASAPRASPCVDEAPMRRDALSDPPKTARLAGSRQC